MNTQTLLIISLVVVFFIFIFTSNNSYIRLGGCSAEPFNDKQSEMVQQLLKLKEHKMPENMPDPSTIIKALRGLVDKYDNPNMWNHAKLVHDKDPGQLARMQLGVPA